MIVKLNLSELVCLRCGHSWYPRIEDVRYCPKCHSAYWDKPKREK